jgi:hypothetical protein
MRLMRQCGTIVIAESSGDGYAGFFPVTGYLWPVVTILPGILLREPVVPDLRSSGLLKRPRPGLVTIRSPGYPVTG